MEFWDERYGPEEFVYGKEPNQFFATEIAGLVPGRLLLPGEGEGRNAVYAASKGWSVSAFDQSVIGAAKAIGYATEKGVHIDYLVCTLQDYPFPKEEFDAVGLIYFHSQPVLREYLHSSVVESLKPGGILILEGFHTSQPGKESGGPSSIDLLFDRARILGDFSNLETVAYKELEITLNEGLYHQGNASIVRYTGKKKTK